MTLKVLYQLTLNLLHCPSNLRIVERGCYLDPLPIEGKQVAYNNRNFDGNFIGVQDGKVKFFNLIIKT